MGKSGKSRKKRRPGLRTLAARLFQYDTNLIVAIFFLMVFGLLLIYSASYYQASMSSKFGIYGFFFIFRVLRIVEIQHTVLDAIRCVMGQEVFDVAGIRHIDTVGQIADQGKFGNKTFVV